jgi:SAM-dependent methyltransferase
MWAVIVLLVIVCFSGVVFIGPPYLPTLSPQVKTALDLLHLKPGQTMLELGCGDGKVLIAAAQRGWKVTGIELNPILVVVCKLRTWRYRRLVTVRWGNYWDIRLWGQADGIFGFVLPKYMSKLDKLIEAWRDGRAVSLASFAFKIPDKPIDREQKGVFLYRY